MVGGLQHDRKPGRHMAMTIEVTAPDGTCVNVRATGGYSPDVMHDLMNRARELLTHAAALMSPDDEEVAE